MAEKKEFVEVNILKMSDSAAVNALFGGVPLAGVPGGYFEYQRRKVVAKMRAALVEAQKINPAMRFRIEVPAVPVEPVEPVEQEVPHMTGSG